MNQFALWLASTPPSVFIQEHNAWAIEAIQSIHIVGIALVMGSVLLIDLRVLGLAWTERRGGFDASGPAVSRILRYIVGLMGVMVLWYGLGAVLPRGEEWIPLGLRFLRYSLVGAWVTGGAPWVFVRLNLTGKAPARVPVQA